MTRKFAILGLLGAVLFSLAWPSQAHYVYTLSGWHWHSIGCRVALKNVPNQDTKPGTVTCRIAPTTTATVYCSVPGNDYTFAGQAGVQPVSASQSLAGGALEKTGGGVYVSEVIPFNPVLTDFTSSCPNPNWKVVAVVLTQFDSTILVTDSSNVVATQVDASCVIPPQYQNTVPPPGTQYVCNVTAQHLN